MQRRTLFKALGSNLVWMLLQRRGRAQTQEAITYEQLAAVVLPKSLGPKRTAQTAADFADWLKGYKAGADTGYGYGHTKPTVSGPYPGRAYPQQLQELAAAAAAKGKPFGALPMDERKAIVQAAIQRSGATAIPRQPRGQHVAVDLMAYFYHSSDGNDFCYNAAIREKDCRGLETSAKRPEPVS